MGDASADEERLADLIAVVTSGRSDALVDAALAGAPPEVFEALRGVRETVSALGASLRPVRPSATLRERLMGSLAARREPRKALLVVDMLNDHLTPGRPLEIPRARAIVPALVKRIDEARRSGIPIVYVLDEHEPDDADLDVWGAHNVRGTDGAAVWPPLAPRNDDVIVRKRTYSAFVQSDLPAVLESLRIDTLVLTGCLTEVGLLVTATDALQRGYAVEVPADAQAGASEVNEQLALGLVRALPPFEPARRALLERMAA